MSTGSISRARRATQTSSLGPETFPSCAVYMFCTLVSSRLLSLFRFCLPPTTDSASTHRCETFMLSDYDSFSETPWQSLSSPEKHVKKHHVKHPQSLMKDMKLPKQKRIQPGRPRKSPLALRRRCPAGA